MGCGKQDRESSSISGDKQRQIRLMGGDESLEGASLIMQVIIAALGLRERQSKQHSRCQTAFQSLSWAFRPTQSIRVASISAIHFHCSFSVCIMCSSKLSECRCEIIWTVSGSLW